MRDREHSPGGAAGSLVCLNATADAESLAAPRRSRDSSVAIPIGECPVGRLNNPARESLGASRAGARLSGSVGDGE
jgi:hypothetical protein